MLKVIEAFLRDEDAGRFPGIATDALRAGLVEARLVGKDVALHVPQIRETDSQVSAIIEEASTGTQDRRTVFLVQGRYQAANEAMTDLLTSLDLRVLAWEEVVQATGEGNPYIGDVLKRGMQDAAAIVVLFTAEERVQLDVSLVPDATSEELRPGHQPRPNVLLEAGMALAAYPKRTLIVQLGDVRAATDLGGKHLLRIGGSGLKWRNDLVTRLGSIGLEPRTTSSRYLTAGTFPAV